MQHYTFARKRDRKSRRYAERLRYWIAQVRRRLSHQERDRRRVWLLLLVLWAVQLRVARLFFPALVLPPYRSPSEDSESGLDNKLAAAADTHTDDARRFLFDYAPRRGEEHLEVMDGLTADDIEKARGATRVRMLQIAGMPERYARERVVFATLVDHMASNYHRPDAFKALSLLAPPQSADFIEKCRIEVEGLSWRSLRMCKRHCHAASIAEVARAAEAHEEMMRREIAEAQEVAPGETDPRKISLN